MAHPAEPRVVGPLRPGRRGRCPGRRGAVLRWQAKARNPRRRPGAGGSGPQGELAMENEPELIRDQMQETRTAMTEKLDTLQQKVSDTVESITTPVTETVQTVKEA